MVSSGLSIVFSGSIEYKQTLSSKTIGMTKEPRLVNKRGCWLGIPWELTKGGMGQTRLWGAAHCPLWIQLPTNSQRLQKPELKSSSLQVCGIPDTGLQNRGLLRVSPLTVPSHNPCWDRCAHAGPLPKGADRERPHTQPEICTCCHALDARYFAHQSLSHKHPCSCSCRACLGMKLCPCSP